MIQKSTNKFDVSELLLPHSYSMVTNESLRVREDQLSTSPIFVSSILYNE